jgi:hypothetical protein
MSTAPSPTRGDMLWKSRRRVGRPTRPGTARRVRS